jgi:PAS domain S-box-containing protein
MLQWLRETIQSYLFAVLAFTAFTAVVLGIIGVVAAQHWMVRQEEQQYAEHLAWVETTLDLGNTPDVIATLEAWTGRLEAIIPTPVTTVTLTQGGVELAHWRLSDQPPSELQRTLTIAQAAAPPLQVTLRSPRPDEAKAWLDAIRFMLLRVGVALPILLWVVWRLLEGPARSVRIARAFLTALPEAVGSHVDVRGHTLELQRLLEAMNNASDLLADQQRRLQDLGEESRRFASVVQNTGVGFILTDAQRSITWINEGFTRLTGYTLEDAAGQHPPDLLKSIGATPNTIARMRAQLKARQRFTGDILAQRRDGERIWLHVEGEPVLDAQGEVTGYMSLHTDAGTRVQAVQQLQRGQSILRAVANVAESMLRTPRWEDALAGALGQLAEASGAQRAFLYRVAEGSLARVASHYTSLFERGLDDDTSRTQPIGTWHQELAGGETLTLGTFPWHADTPAQRDGNVALVPVQVAGSWWGVLVFDGGIGAEPWTEVERLAFGTAANILAAAIDNDLNERALSSERAFAAQVLERVFDGVAVIDAGERIVYANPALQTMLPHDREDLIGRSLPALGLLPAPLSSDHLLAAAEAQRRQHGAYEVTLPAGAAPRTLLVRASAEALEGDPPRRILLLTDVTERKRLEVDLQRTAAAAEAANEAKSRLLARVSHELRTPLNAVMGFAQLAALDALTPDLEESLHEIQRAGKHLNRLINDLIDLSSTQSGELSIAFEAVAMEEIAQEALSLIRPASQQAGLSLVPLILKPATVIADPGRLMQIVLNLLSNAVKYNRPGGTVSLRVLHSSDGAHGRLEIEDSGPGIAREEFPRLFIPFERLSNAGERAGTGIGLALSSILAERMGGRIGVRSELGQGSCFWVEFALAPNKQRGAWGDARG